MRVEVGDSPAVVVAPPLPPASACTCSLIFRNSLDCHLRFKPVRDRPDHLVLLHFDLHPQLRHCGFEEERKAAATVPPASRLRPHLQQWCGPFGGWHFLVVDRGEVLCASRLGGGCSGTWPCTSSRTHPPPALAVFWRCALWCIDSERVIATAVRSLMAKE